MKKLIALLLALTMTLSLAACGGAKTETPAPDASAASSESSEEKSAPEGDTGEQERVSAVPVVSLTEQAEGELTADDGTVVLTYAYDVPKVTIDGGEAEQAIQAELDTLVADYKAYLDVMGEEAAEFYTSAAEGGEDVPSYMYTYTSEQRITVTRCDEEVISLVVDNMGYTGGAHGWDNRYTRVFDAKTGKRLTFEDVGGEAFVSFCHDNVLAQADKMQAEGDEQVFFDDYAENIDKVLQDGTKTAAEVYGDPDYGDDIVEASWYFNDEGVVFISGQYLLQTYAAGIIEFTVTYEELAGVLNEAYQH